MRERVVSARARSKHQIGENMKLCVETKVAAAIAAGFIALTAGVIAQGYSGGHTGGPYSYGPTNNPGVNTHMNRQGYNSSLSGRTNAEENRQKFSGQDETATTPNKGKRRKSLRSRKHHTERTRQNERTESNQPGD